MAHQAPDPDFILRGCKSPVTSILYFEDDTHKSRTLLAGTEEGSIYIWDAHVRRITRQVEAHAGSVLSMCRIPHIDSKIQRVLTQGRDGNIHLWNVHENLWTISKTYRCNSLGFCPMTTLSQKDDYLVAYPAEDQTQCNILELNSGNIIYKMAPKGTEVRYGMLMGIKFATKPEESHPKVLASYEDGSVVLWDISSQNELSRLKTHLESVMCMDYDINLNRGISGSVDENIFLWTINKADWTICEHKQILLTNPGVNCARFRSDGKLFAVGGWDHNVRLFGTKQGKPLVVLVYHKESVQCLAFAEDNSLIAGSKDGTISVWSVYK